MSRLIPLVVLAALLGPALSPLAAQELPKELEVLKPLIGKWQGKGTANMGPEGPSAPWTSRSHMRPVLGGRFLREDVIITIKGPMPMEIAFISLFAWDAERERIVNYMVGNNGTMGRADIEVHDGVMVSMIKSFENGEASVERWKTLIAGDKVSFIGHRLGAAGGPFVSVEGENTRVDSIEPLHLEKMGAFMMAPNAELKRLAKTAGHYTVKGEYRMAPGADPTQFEGTEVITPLFGGLVVQNAVTGDGYEHIGFMSWDPLGRRIVRFSFSNWGDHHEIGGHWIDDQHLAFHFSGEMMGTKHMVRTSLALDASGQITRSWADAMTGVAAPYKSFEASYKLQASGQDR